MRRSRRRLGFSAKSSGARSTPSRARGICMALVGLFGSIELPNIVGGDAYRPCRTRRHGRDPHRGRVSGEPRQHAMRYGSRPAASACLSNTACQPLSAAGGRRRFRTEKKEPRVRGSTLIGRIYPASDPSSQGARKLRRIAQDHTAPRAARQLQDGRRNPRRMLPPCIRTNIAESGTRLGYARTGEPDGSRR